MKLLTCLLLLPLLAQTEELRLQIKAKFLVAPTAPLRIEVSTTGEPRPILVGLKPADRTNVRVHCLAVLRDLNSIKRLLAVPDTDCQTDENPGRITLANHSEDYTAHTVLIEVPNNTTFEVRWNGVLIHEGLLPATIILDGGKARAVELKGLDTLILQSLRSAIPQ